MRSRRFAEVCQVDKLSSKRRKSGLCSTVFVVEVEEDSLLVD